VTYNEKLLSPKWQKKRLKILERDNFTCQFCQSKEDTLHIHHKKYSEGEPWEIEDKYLITLCKECHESETLDKKTMTDHVLGYTKVYNCTEMLDLFFLLDLLGEDDIGNKLGTLAFVLKNEELFDLVSDLRKEYIKKVYKESRLNVALT
jgi:hypothetical protein